MSYPPQQPWHQGGGHNPQQPQQWGGQPTGQPSTPQWGWQQSPQLPGQQWGGRPGGQPSPQPWNSQQAPHGGPQQWGYQSQQWNGQQWGGPAPQRSKTGLWVGIGIGAVLLVALIVTLILVLGGGKYAGKERPALPDEFGGWSRVDESQRLGISFGNLYEKDGKQLTVLESDLNDIDEDQPKGVDDEENETTTDKAEVEKTKPAPGVDCVNSERDGRRITVCVVLYEDKKVFSVMAFDPDDGSGVPSKSEVEQAAVELSKQK